MPLLLLFIAIPLIEIALFITVGGAIGLWPTLAIVILTALIGTYMLREQGLREVARLRQSLEQMSDPTDSLAHGAMILFAGSLLLTPGFFTDTIGFLLLIPSFRAWMMRTVRARMNIQTFSVGGDQGFDYQDPRTPRSPQGTVIDGEFYEVEPGSGKPGNSGWTKH